MSTLVIVILLLLVLGVFGTAPVWPHSVQWGPWPSGALGLVFLVLVILLLTGRL